MLKSYRGTAAQTSGHEPRKGDLMADISALKLGCNPSPQHEQDKLLKLSSYQDALPALPPSVDWRRWILKPLGMLLNDQLGCCVPAGAAHLIDCWTANCGAETVIQDADVLVAYEQAGGYNPNDANTDQGMMLTDMLRYWKATGVGGHKIDGAVTIKPTVPFQFQQAIALFGGVYAAVSLPVSAQAQIQAGQAWDVPAGGATGDGAPGGWGGHCIPFMAYSPGRYVCCTWGAWQPCTQQFITTYCDEAYAVLSSQDWVGERFPWASVNLSPSMATLAQLQADLKALAA